VGLGVGAIVGLGVGRGVHALWPVSSLVNCVVLQLAQIVLPAEPAYVSTAHGVHAVTLLLPSCVYTLATVLNRPATHGTQASGVWSTAQ
jgi:hypothetical protein